MYRNSAKVYDAIYSFKDYIAEAKRLRELILERHAGATTLLDVACGTGKHLEQFGKWFIAEGLELDEAMLNIARERNPNLMLHQGDMRNFALPKTFSAVTCLFSAIGYLPSVAALEQAIATMAEHLEANGVLIIEPWFTPEQWQAGTVHALCVDKPEFKIARMNLSEQRGSLAVMDMHHLVGTPQGVKHFVEHHEMFLFSHDEYMTAFTKVGLSPQFDPEGIMGRGLYIGQRQFV